MDNNATINPPIQNTPTPTVPSNNKTPKQSHILFISLLIGFCLIVAVIIVVSQIWPKSESISESNSAQIDTEENKTSIEEVDNTLAAENPDFYSAIIDANEANGQIGDHVRGKADSRVVVIEYADYQCPGCATMMPYMNSIYEEYKDSVAFVFRNYPLSFHANAEPAASAAEAAGLQDYFWEMTDALYAKRANWISLSGTELKQSFVNIFKSVAPSGDVQKFMSDFSSTRVSDKITYDYNLGREKAKINGTPTVIVNGKIISSDFATFDDFVEATKTEIDEQLAK